MILRKINSYISLVATTFFVIHAGLMCLLLSGGIPYRPWYKPAGFILLAMFGVHAILSLIIYFRDKNKNEQGKVYWKGNKTTIIQRVLAVLMLLMTVMHVKNGIDILIYQVIFIAITSAHIGISFPRALLTVGAIESEKAYKRFQIISAIFCAGMAVWSAISYGVYATMIR